MNIELHKASPPVESPGWLPNDTAPEQICAGWVKLYSGEVEPAMRFERYRNGEKSWGWFDKNGFVIGWTDQIVAWMPRDQ